jgi:excisionase family DNA binding protein
VRDAFRESVTRAAVGADVSASVGFEHAPIACEKDVNTAAKALGITPGGVRWALRNGTLGGRKLGRQWLIGDDDIELYRRRCA